MMIMHVGMLNSNVINVVVLFKMLIVITYDDDNARQNYQYKSNQCGGNVEKV